MFLLTKTVSIKDFIHGTSEVGISYKDYWKESNIDKNVFLPHEQFMTIERRIIWSAVQIGMSNIKQKVKTTKLAGEVAKYHISGEGSIQDSIKGLATDYKRQKAVRILKGVGNMGIHAGDPGSAARYTSVMGTPILRAMIRDIKHIPLIVDETGLEQPEYISSPLPMVLINGISNIGTGHSAYYDERDAREVIDWIEDLVEGRETVLPDPISTTGCKVWKNPTNGYTYYEAVVHREGHYDIITKVPPKTSSTIILQKLRDKFPKKADLIEDASEDGRPIWIKVPKNLLKPEDYNKYSMRRARIEQPYIWDTELDTMRMSTHEEVALAWYKERIKIIKKRLESNVEDIDREIHKIDLIKRYVDEKMNLLTINEIEELLGKEGADIVLSQSARTLVKENVEKSQVRKAKLLEEREMILGLDAKRVLFEEARNIIQEQEDFFNSFDDSGAE